MTARLRISVVDDDVSVRESLRDLMTTIGLDVRVFASAAEFLASGAIGNSDCLVLDVAMPGMTGPELHLELLRLGHGVPVVFITALRDEGTRSRLLKQGAIECMFKPFDENALIEALTKATTRS